MRRRKFLNRTVMMLVPAGIAYQSEGNGSENGQGGDGEGKCEEGTYQGTKDGEVICFSNKLPGEDIERDPVGYDDYEHDPDTPGLVYGDCEYPEDTPCDEDDDERPPAG